MASVADLRSRIRTLTSEAQEAQRRVQALSSGAADALARAQPSNRDREPQHRHSGASDRPRDNPNVWRRGDPPRSSTSSASRPSDAASRLAAALSAPRRDAAVSDSGRGTAGVKRPRSDAEPAVQRKRERGAEPEASSSSLPLPTGDSALEAPHAVTVTASSSGDPLPVHAETEPHTAIVSIESTETPAPAAEPSNASSPPAAREKRPSARGGDALFTARSRRMMGVMLSHLNTAKSSLDSDASVRSKQASAQAAAVAHDAARREEAIRAAREAREAMFAARDRARAEVQVAQLELSAAVQRGHIEAVLGTSSTFILTTATPALYWRPAELSAATRPLAAASAAKAATLAAERRAHVDAWLAAAKEGVEKEVAAAAQARTVRATPAAAATAPVAAVEVKSDADADGAAADKEPAGGDAAAVAAVDESNAAQQQGDAEPQPEASAPGGEQAALGLSEADAAQVPGQADEAAKPSHEVIAPATTAGGSEEQLVDYEHS